MLCFASLARGAVRTWLSVCIVSRNVHVEAKSNPVPRSLVLVIPRPIPIPAEATLDPHED
jgi:hypothetical protein